MNKKEESEGTGRLENRDNCEAESKRDTSGSENGSSTAGINVETSVEKKGERSRIANKRETRIPIKEALAVRYVKKRAAALGKSENRMYNVSGDETNAIGRNDEEKWTKLSEDEKMSAPESSVRSEEEKLLENKVETPEEFSGSSRDTAEDERSSSSASPRENSVARLGKNSLEQHPKLGKLQRNSVRKDCLSLARQIRARRKEKSALLKSCLERRVESFERIIEDRVERILDETTEKHPWFQPIENWIVDHCKTSRIAGPDFDSENDDKERSSSSVNSPESSETRSASAAPDDDDSEKCEIFENASNDSTGTKKTAEKLDGFVDSTDSSPDIPKSRIEKQNHTCDFVEKIRNGIKERVEDVQKYFQRTSRLADVNRKLKSQIWSSVVTIVLVEAKNLLPMDIDGLSDPYVKFRLGTEKYKSKVINKTLSPVWLEQFDLHLYEDPYLGQELEVTVWDRDKGHQDDLMGRTTIDLASLERETTHRLWRELEDGAGNIFILLTISGTTASETISDLAAHEETAQERSRLLQRYALVNSLQRPRDVGHLTVKVYRAQGLAAADLGGKSDPFCVLELVNARLQTQTEYKTLAPNWQKIFTFNVKDINSVLEVTVYDEDRDHKVEFLGRVAVPLLRIHNAEKRWYALKDKKLRGRAKGNSPQILLEMIVVWNVLRACVRTLNPKEQKYMEPEIKFKRQVFLRNVLRLKAVIVYFIDMGKYIQSCWEWESKTRSAVALVLFVLGCYYFEPWMLPFVALLILLKYCLVAMLTGGTAAASANNFPNSYGHLHDSGEQSASAVSDDFPATPGGPDDDDDEDDKDKEEKKSLKERLQAIQEVTQTVQNSIGYIASLCERIKNLFNFTVPYLSYVAMVLTILGVTVLYLIPMRYLILVWGVNKFLRKLLRPHSVPNNEILDLVSRVPDDEDLLSYRELKPLPTADCERGGAGASSSTGSNVGSGVGGGQPTRRDHRKKHKAA